MFGWGGMNHGEDGCFYCLIICFCYTSHAFLEKTFYTRLVESLPVSGDSCWGCIQDQTQRACGDSSQSAQKSYSFFPFPLRAIRTLPNNPAVSRGLRFIFSVHDIVCGSLITCTSQSRRSPSFEDSDFKKCCRSFLVTGIDTSIL